MPKFRELLELGADFDDISKTFTKDEIIHSETYGYYKRLENENA